MQEKFGAVFLAHSVYFI